MPWLSVWSAYISEARIDPTLHKMPSFSALAVLVFSVLSLAFATPVKRQTTQCNPNFEGTAVSIVTSQNEEWIGLGPATPGVEIGIQPVDTVANFRLEFSGSSSSSYLIK